MSDGLMRINKALMPSIKRHLLGKRFLRSVFFGEAILTLIMHSME